MIFLRNIDRNIFTSTKHSELKTFLKPNLDYNTALFE